MALTEKYDVVLASSGPITVGIPALVGKFLKRKKMVFEIRDLWPQGALELGKIKNRFLKSVALAFEKSCYKNSKLVVGCSPGMTASVNNRYPDVKTLVISNASDIELFARQPEIKSLPDNLKNKKLILYTGSLGLMDNGTQMIDAMHYIHDNNIILVIIGDGAERSVLEKRVEEHKLTNVVFLGLIPKTEVARWLSHATACLVLFKNYPVLQTSSPNKMFDAFAAGKPVIHNTTGWIKNLFDRENCGISVKPDDAHELAAAIEQMSHNQNLQKAYSANALRLAKEMFNRDSLADTYLSELDKINQ